MLVDDNLIWDKTLEDSYRTGYRLLEIYGKAGLFMNSDKFQFGQDVVEFAGMQVPKISLR